MLRETWEDYVKTVRDLNQRQRDRLLDCVKVSENAMKASYMLAELIAKQKSLTQ